MATCRNCGARSAPSETRCAVCGVEIGDLATETAPRTPEATEGFLRPAAPAIYPPAQPLRRRNAFARNPMLAALLALLTIALVGGAIAFLKEAPSDSDASAPVSSELADRVPEPLREIYALMEESARDKAKIQGAARQLSACRDLERAATIFVEAERSRNSLAASAGALDVSASPEAEPLIRELVEAWQYSARADEAFAAAARATPCGEDSSDLERAVQLSTQSHPHKERAARLWNVLAKQHGLPSINGSEL